MEWKYPVVKTQFGPVRGVTEDGIHRFLGIPYAAPPVGKLRFQAPQPHPGWTEPLDCLSYPDRCPVISKWGGLYPEGTTEEERRYAAIKKSRCWQYGLAASGKLQRGLPEIEPLDSIAGQGDGTGAACAGVGSWWRLPLRMR